MTDASNDIPEPSSQVTTSEGPDDVESADPDPVTSTSALRPRRPPAGLPRRDRRAWRALELERFQRLTTEAAATARHQRTGWQHGFLTNPPPTLGRRGRRAWLDSERDETRRWWQERRASNQDIDARAVGVLIIALLLGAAMIWGILTSRSPGDQTFTAATPLATLSTVRHQIAEAPSTIVTQPLEPAETLTTAVTVPSSSASYPTVVAPLAGMWQPAPIGGVTLVPPATSSLIDPKSVAVQTPPTGPVSATDLATPVAAVTTWLTRTCPSRWSDPYGQDLQRGRSAMTTAGWTEDDPAGHPAGARVWAKLVVPARQTRACGDLAVHLSADAPTTGGTAFVGYTADRVVTAVGTPAVVEHLVGARIVVQQSDGRWLVDRAVLGG